jgi:hypothetical protein
MALKGAYLGFFSVCLGVSFWFLFPIADPAGVQFEMSDECCASGSRSMVPCLRPEFPGCGVERRGGKLRDMAGGGPLVGLIDVREPPLARPRSPLVPCVRNSRQSVFEVPK